MLGGQDSCSASRPRSVSQRQHACVASPAAVAQCSCGVIALPLIFQQETHEIRQSRVTGLKGRVPDGTLPRNTDVGTPDELKCLSGKAATRLLRRSWKAIDMGSQLQRVL